MFCVDLRTNSDFFCIQHYLIGLYNRDEKCFLRGTHWVFKLEGYRIVLIGLIQFCIRILTYLTILPSLEVLSAVKQPVSVYHIQVLFECEMI